MTTLPVIKNVFCLVREYFSNQSRLILPLFAIFILPSFIRPIISRLLLSSHSPIRIFAGIVLSIIISVFYPLGLLSISLCTYAWLKKKRSTLRAILRSLNSIAGYAISTYIGQALIVAVPIGLLMILLFAFHASSANRNAILSLFSNAIYSFLFFFTWPLLIIKRIFGMRNVIACLKLSKDNYLVVLSIISAPVLLLLILEVLTMRFIPLQRDIIVSLSYLAFFPLAAAAMCAYRVIYSEDFDMPIGVES